MKNIFKIAGVAAVALALTQSLQAVPITGNIGFTGGVTINSSTVGSATAVTSWITPQVTLDSGTFSSIPSGTAATFSPAVWTFLTTSAVANFWSVAGFTFTLNSSSILSQGGTPGVDAFVVVTGTGVVSGNGYDATYFNWSFTTQDPKSGTNPDSWTFSASASSLAIPVPDGGETVMLIGIALSGVALLRRRLTA